MDDGTPVNLHMGRGRAHTSGNGSGDAVGRDRAKSNSNGVNGQGSNGSRTRVSASEASGNGAKGSGARGGGANRGVVSENWASGVRASGGGISGGGTSGSGAETDGARGGRPVWSTARFEAAAAEHQLSAWRLLNAPQSDLSDSSPTSSEGEGEGGEDGGEVEKRGEDRVSRRSILQRMMTAFGSNPLIGEGLGRTQGYISSTLSHSANVCLICIETVKKSDPVWNCVSGCHSMFHLACIQRWIKDGVYQQSTSPLSTHLFPNQPLPPWFCPKCRAEYSQSDAPRRYFCFCGKVADPEFDPWLVPHSCGGVCGRPLYPHCGHSCLLLCHPGPCPPCPQMVERACYCGRAARRMLRCGAALWACTQVCSKALRCGLHACTQPCHPDECAVCPKSSARACLCGRTVELRPCASPAWQCVEVCGRALSCGQHSCVRVCHAGECGPCPRSGPRTCSCGKTRFELACTEEAPSCVETCDKLLECGSHACTERCHSGACGTCREMILKRCRCRRKERLVQCFKEFLCDTKCTNMRDCHNHPCKRKCCDGQCPPCTQACAKPLSCRQHKCASNCHTGPCYPCPLVMTVACACGQTTTSVPCGAERQTKPPKCCLPCRKPPDCHHAERERHRCHGGPCPPCKQPCTKPRAHCPHPCLLPCHSAVLTVTKSEQGRGVRVGPWEQLPAPRLTVVALPCPPCQVPLAVPCLGVHEVQSLACSEAGSRSCARACGRLLACTNHRCAQPCHTVRGAPDDSLAGETCDVCEERCLRERPVGCVHPCLSPCHPAQDPAEVSGPCAPCRQRVRMRCHCQLVVLHVECAAWTRASPSQRTALQACQSLCPKLRGCGHACASPCHPAPCPSMHECTQAVRVRCACKRRTAVFPCSAVQAGEAALGCDELCEAARLQADQASRDLECARTQQQQLSAQQQLAQFERTRPGAARPRRRARPRPEEQPHALTLQRAIVWVTAPLLLACLAYFLYSLLTI